jgi:hypothetical protein
MDSSNPGTVISDHRQMLGKSLAIKNGFKVQYCLKTHVEMGTRLHDKDA